ncbi:MAG: hypothetical protein M8364_11970 [Methylobacter sp.]|uniref:hypothetical protein n=1 Tax=Methylobacter sp. TaxID=2051955 RepID=UPI00258E84D7|nr:hypothetical protein [Methylobacter sp.]MCL7421609.1 hypothetical protein [Methylobacter sp.]
MTENSNNENLDKEEAEREKVRAEMWASVNKQNEEYGPETQEAQEKKEQELIQIAQKEKEESKKNLHIGFVLLVVGSVAIYNNHPIIGYTIVFISILIIFLFSIFLMSSLNSSENSQITIYGHLNESMICPHCNKKGQISTQTVTNKKGISGGKATAALITSGWSLLVTGLSREEKQTQAHCMNCNNTWTF